MPNHVGSSELHFEATTRRRSSVSFRPSSRAPPRMKAGANAGRAPLGVLPVEQATAEKFTRPRNQCHDSIIYELHVKGFTARENSGVTKENRRKFLGLVEKIPYLKELGVTVVD